MKMTRERFIEYLREQLIPDLRESGSDAMADDLEAAAAFIENPNLKEVEL